MTDKFYKKQLESFGIESLRITNVSLNKKIEKERYDSNMDVVKSLMATMEGRQWLYGILDVCRVFTSPFAGEKTHTTAFLAGVQTLGHKFLDDIMKASPEKYYVMVQEENARRKGDAVKDDSD